MDFQFFLSAILLGLGLAMDACAVSMANGLKEPCMKVGKITLIALLFALFQAAMPMLGWVCVHTVVEKFEAFGKVVPFIALGLLAFIGGKMLVEGIKHKDCESQDECGCAKPLTFGALIVQAIATSIDALSVGFTIAHYDWLMALVCCLVIAVVTFILCAVGILLGKTFGTKLAGKASIFGGSILIIIGIKIFIEGVFLA